MLTDVQCRKAQPRDKPYKLADSKGLHLLVNPGGSKLWRWKYRLDGKEKQLAFGPYPEVSLAEARDAREAASKAKRSGVDPSLLRRSQQARRQVERANTFMAIAELWHERQKPTWRPKHAASAWRQMEDDVFPAIGDMPIGEIRAPEILALLRKVEDRGAIDLAHRLRQRVSATFVFAIASGLAQSDPAATIGAALRPIPIGHHPALRTIEDARALIEASEKVPSNPLTRLAARLIAVTAARSEAVRLSSWTEFENLDGAEPRWRVPAEHMKGKLAQRANASFEFIVPLPAQAVEIVKAAHRLSVGGPLLFPSNRHAHRPMSDNAISSLYRRLPAFAGRHVPHGWRATFSTIMNERAVAMDRPEDRAVIDLMLAHAPSGVEAIYNRAAYMPRRRRLAQEWADLLLEGLPSAASLLEGPRS